MARLRSKILHKQRLNQATILLGLLIGLVGAATPAPANVIWDYLKQYQFGIDYANSSDGVQASYETNRVGGQLGPGCEALNDSADRQTCTVGTTAGGSSGFGFFIQQAFKRQGLFYFRADLGFGVRYLQGSVSRNDLNQTVGAGLPLRAMDFSLAALVMKPYVQVGITPASNWPDLLLSIGPAAQVALGTVAVNNESENVAIATRSGFIDGFSELELVFWRFGDGAFSAYASRDFTGGDGTAFYPEEIDGMDDFKANFSRRISGQLYGFGLKLLLNWP